MRERPASTPLARERPASTLLARERPASTLLARERPASTLLARERPASTGHGWPDHIFLLQDGAYMVNWSRPARGKWSAIHGRCSRDARAPDDLFTNLGLELY